MFEPISIILGADSSINFRLQSNSNSQPIIITIIIIIDNGENYIANVTLIVTLLLLVSLILLLSIMIRIILLMLLLSIYSVIFNMRINKCPSIKFD